MKDPFPRIKPKYSVFRIVSDQPGGSRKMRLVWRRLSSRITLSLVLHISHVSVPISVWTDK